MKGLSAGRVQSVATRLVVERERERIEFRAAEYWDIVAHARPAAASRRGSSRSTAGRSRRAATSPATASSPPRRRPARRGDGASLADRARGRRAHRQLGRAQAVHAPPGGAVHDLDAPAGGEPQAPVHGAAHDARRPAPLRERLHHLHAHRLDLAGRVGGRRGARPGARALRRRLGPRAAALVQPEGQERAGGARGDPPGRRPFPHARRGEAARSSATRPRCTT